jgi:hypothetical protein
MSEYHPIAEASGATFGLARDEACLDAKADATRDVVKYRGSSPYADGWLVAWSGDVKVGDTRYEKGMFGIRHDDDFPKDVQAFEFALYLQDPGGTEDATMRCRWRVTTRGVEVNGQPLVGSIPAFMQSPDGRWRTQQQSDGNFVTYDMTAPGGPKAVWSAWHGKIG